MVNATTSFMLNSKKIDPIRGIDNTKFEKGTIRTDNEENMFSTIFNSAVENINTTNSYLSKAENEEIKLALGQTDNTHDLAIALQKASTTLQYTVAIRDKFLEAYKEIMNTQI